MHAVSSGNISSKRSPSWHSISFSITLSFSFTPVQFSVLLLPIVMYWKVASDIAAVLDKRFSVLFSIFGLYNALALYDNQKDLCNSAERAKWILREGLF